MQITLTHIHRNLWVESRILENLIDKDGNPKAFGTIINEAHSYAISRASNLMGCKKKDANKTEEYRNTFGWMGEIVSEFWLKVFGQRYDIVSVTDTSQNQFQRGYDYTGCGFFDTGMSVLIQVKMMEDSFKSFKKGKLFTFLDEAEKAASLPQYTILMVPTSDLSSDEILSYKDDFKEDYRSKIRYFGKSKMSSDIRTLPTMRNGLDGHHEFLLWFKESLELSSVKEI